MRNAIKKKNEFQSPNERAGHSLPAKAREDQKSVSLLSAVVWDKAQGKERKGASSSGISPAGACIWSLVVGRNGTVRTASRREAYEEGGGGGGRGVFATWETEQ